MANTVAILQFRPGDEGVCRDLHVAGGFGDGHDARVAVGKGSVVGINNSSVNFLLKYLEGARRNAVAGEHPEGIQA